MKRTLTLIILASICSIQSASASSPTTGDQRVSVSGAIFNGDISNPALGKAYRDPSGLIWGSIIFETLDQDGASRTCHARNARLPTREEFQALSKYLGSGSAQGYSYYTADHSTPVLPGLGDLWFWSSSVDQDYSPATVNGREISVIYGFYGGNGDFNSEFGHWMKDAVVCVSGR